MIASLGHLNFNLSIVCMSFGVNLIVRKLNLATKLSNKAGAGKANKTDKLAKLNDLIAGLKR